MKLFSDAIIVFISFYHLNFLFSFYFARIILLNEINPIVLNFHKFIDFIEMGSIFIHFINLFKFIELN